MKRIFIAVLVLLAASLQAQSPLSVCTMAEKDEPLDPNMWSKVGFQLNYPLVGERDAFDLRFGLGGKLVISAFEFDLGRPWYLVTYGNFGLPNSNNVQTFNNTISSDDGLHFGLQAYSIFGKIYTKALTTSLILGTKINTFGNTQVVSYRFGTGVELSLAEKNKLPLIVSFTPTYILLKNKAEFAMLQSERVGRGVWTADAYIILPVGEKLGLLVQSTFAEQMIPQYRVGVIVTTGL